MTKEEKELLLKDLCVRLPYSTLCYCKWTKDAPNDTSGCVQEVSTYLLEELMIIGDPNYECQICEIKPYLRPMSSMTEDEKREYDKLLDDCEEQDRADYNITTIVDSMLFYVIDWLNEHHFDYRGLIPMGLALGAPEDMYSSTTKSITLESIKYGNDKVVKDAERVILSPEKMKEIEDRMYNENGWKDIGNGLKMDRHGNIAGGVKFNKSCAPCT